MSINTGEVSHGTLRAEDLAMMMIAELESVQLDGDIGLDKPENFGMRDAVANCLGALQDLITDDDGTVRFKSFGDGDAFDGIFHEGCDLLTSLAPPFVYFGSHEGDGSCFGFWGQLPEPGTRVRWTGINKLEGVTTDLGITWDDGTFCPEERIDFNYLWDALEIADCGCPDYPGEGGAYTGRKWHRAPCTPTDSLGAE